MEFEWNEEKYRTNLAKHKILFEDAIAVFADPHELTESSAYAAEPRLETNGRAGPDAILFVVHTLRGAPGEERIRIISARPASRMERLRYEQRR